ncbi:MAG: helix-turn-helix transcriptional regulator [Gemmatimonadota bacterium]
MNQNFVSHEAEVPRIRARAGEIAFESLLELIDTLSEGAVFVDRMGVLSHRNRALTSFLANEPESGLILDTASQCGRRTLKIRSAHDDGRAGDTRLEDFRLVTSRAVYSVRSGPVFVGQTKQTLALVLIDRASPALPSAECLRARFHLTPREAEVALLLAQGQSDVAIGLELGVSRHTARHHGERVFAKIGIHTRKALSLRLM